MKPSFLLTLGLALTAPVAWAQSTGQGPAPQSNGNGQVADQGLQVSLQRNTAAPNRKATVTRKVQVGGPIVNSLKSNPQMSAPKRLLQLINPFAPSEAKPEISTRTEGISTRAWTSVAGWNPGGSAFPDAVTHEPQMTLVSFSKKSR